MKKYSVKMGVAPTRRFIFSKEDAFLYKDKTYQKLDELGIEYVGIDDINDEGLLHSENDIEKVIAKFRAEKIDCLFFPHCNFGTEDLVCKVAAEFKLPVLLWGPRDEMPLKDGSRLRDTQCGLFATGKVLRRFNLPFTYIPNDRLEDASFERGVKNFVAAANVVREVKNTRVLQIATRPAGFWTVMCNEGELLEKFGIQVHPVTLSYIVSEVRRMNEDTSNTEVAETIEFLNASMKVEVNPDEVRRVAALKVAMEHAANDNGCNSIAIQCWDSLQHELSIMPCVCNSILTDLGIPVACETDIHGAISAVLAQAATMGQTSPFFADWTVRHPDNDNAELLQHCGPYPLSLAKDKPILGRPFALPGKCAGAVLSEIKGGEMTILRFDGDHGEYKLLAGKAKGIDGPYIMGTYVWIEVEDWLALERKLVEGPYIHHCVGVHGDFVPVVYEACKYIPALEIDLYDADAQKKIDAYLYGK